MAEPHLCEVSCIIDDYYEVDGNQKHKDDRADGGPLSGRGSDSSESESKMDASTCNRNAVSDVLDPRSGRKSW